MDEIKLGEQSTKTILGIIMQIPEITNIMNAYIEAKGLKESVTPEIEIKFKKQK